MRTVEQLVVGITLLQLILGCYPLECYSCDSAENAECATRPGQQLEVEECASSTDECVISITAGLTRRGCLKRLYPNGYCAEPCDRCTTSLCNRHVYPVNRLQCYQCSGADCIDVSQRPSLLLPCPIYNSNDRCYTNILHLSNTQRGCEYSNLPDTCPHVCLKCNYNGCNMERTVSESRCLQCTHTSYSPNSNCLRDQNQNHDTRCALSNATVTQCTNKVMYGHKERCYTHRNSQTNVLQRGCSTTMGFFPTGELTECYGDNCNDHCQDIACATCNSTTDAKCRVGLSLSSKQCVPGTVSCYSCEQGCADADFMPGAKEVCQLCRNGDACNRWSVRSCYRCNSQNPEDDCALMIEPSVIPISNCTASTEMCVNTVVSRLQSVYTVRGCAGEVPECTSNDPYCVRCNGSLCNSIPTVWGTRYAKKQVQFAEGRTKQSLRLFDYLWPSTW